jgi:3-oxoadipate enol-lactonase
MWPDPARGIAVRADVESRHQAACIMSGGSWAASTEDCRVTTRVGTLALADEGTGTPVVLWPSLFSDRRLYGHVQRLLGTGWRTLRIDGPGFGRSAPPRGDVQADVYAGAVLDVLDALGIERAFVAGCSWGGQIAAHVGATAADRVRGVLIMNAPLGPSLGGHVFEVYGTRWFGSTTFWGNGVVRSMVSPATRQAHPDRVRDFVAAFPSFDRRAAATTVRTVLTRFPGLEAVLPKLAVPTVILMGAEDRLYPVERMRRLARLAPAATVESVPSCGHLAPLEAAEAVVAALQRLAAADVSGRPIDRSAGEQT